MSPVGSFLSWAGFRAAARTFLDYHVRPIYIVQSNRIVLAQLVPDQPSTFHLLILTILVLLQLPQSHVA